MDRDAIRAIETLNELPVATQEDLHAGLTAIQCGEDHPWGCLKVEVVKMVAEYEHIVTVEYGWMKTPMAQCELVGKA